MTATDDFLDQAQACLARIRELTSHLDPLTLTVPVPDGLTPEAARSALENVLSQEPLLEQLNREANHEMQLLRAAGDAALLEIDAARLGRRQKKRKKVGINQARRQILNHCQNFKTLVDQGLDYVAECKQHLSPYTRQDPDQS